VNNAKRLESSLVWGGHPAIDAFFALSPMPPSARGAKLDKRSDFSVFGPVAADGNRRSPSLMSSSQTSVIGYHFMRPMVSPPLVSYRTVDGRVTAANTIQGDLKDDSSAVFVIIDAGSLQTGWARLYYDGESRIGGRTHLSAAGRGYGL